LINVAHHLKNDTRATGKEKVAPIQALMIW
jgi:hypothetical protein